MTDAPRSDGPPPPPPPPIPPGYPGPGVRQLRRRPDEGPIAGVCAGLADYFGIDVVLVRIAAVVLAFSGPGLIAYVLAWIFVPPVDSTVEPPRPRRDGGDHGAQVFGLILLAVAVTALWGGWWSPVRRWIFPLALIGLGAWMLLRRPERDEGALAEAEPPAPADASAPLAPSPTPTPTSIPTPTPTPAPTPTSRPSLPWGRDEPTARHHGGRPPGLPWCAPTPEPVEEHRLARRRRRRLGSGVLGTLLLWAGAAALLTVSVQTALAVAVGIVGVGFILGAFVGGSKALIAPALVLGLALLVTTLSPVSFHGPIGQRSWTPRTLDALEGHYEMSMGEGRLDLTELDLAGREVVDVRATIGVGHLVVWVPEDVTLQVDASTSAGEISVLGRRDSGIGVSTARTIEGPASAPTLALDLEVGFGEIEVIELPISAPTSTTSRSLG